MFRVLQSPVDSRLAAEYVLGVLNGAARRRFERLLAHDRDLQKRVAQWTESFVPIGLGRTDRAPSARLWQSIEAKLGRPRTQAFPRLRALIAGIAVGAGAAALLLPATLVTTRGEGEIALPAPPVAGDAFPHAHVSVLVDVTGTSVALVTATRDANFIEVRAVREIPGGDLELWLEAYGAAPRSLGRAPNTGATRIELGTPVGSIFLTGSVLVLRSGTEVRARGEVVRSW